jgi:DinB family protein
MPKLENNEYASFYQPYIQVLLNSDENLIENLQSSQGKALQILKNLDSKKQLFQYAEGKWTIKEIIQHIIDAERVFNYRALRFARKDTTDLSGFDENHYVRESNANTRDFFDLLEEFSLLRKSTILMYQNFTNDALLLKGKASGEFISVRALGFITSGHLLHHLHVIKTKYLS